MQSATKPANLGQGRNVQSSATAYSRGHLREYVVHQSQTTPHTLPLARLPKSAPKMGSRPSKEMCNQVIGAAIRIPGTCKEHRSYATLGVVFRSADVAEQSRVYLCCEILQHHHFFFGKVVVVI